MNTELTSLENFDELRMNYYSRLQKEADPENDCNDCFSLQLFTLPFGFLLRDNQHFPDIPEISRRNNRSDPCR